MVCVINKETSEQVFYEVIGLSLGKGKAVPLQA